MDLTKQPCQSCNYAIWFPSVQADEEPQCCITTFSHLLALTLFAKKKKSACVARPAACPRIVVS